jgi:hypothetical protein
MFASAIQAVWHAAGAGAGPAIKRIRFQKGKLANGQTMPPTASNRELATVRPAVEPGTANQLDASGGLPSQPANAIASQVYPAALLSQNREHKVGQLHQRVATDFVSL